MKIYRVTVTEIYRKVVSVAANSEKLIEGFDYGKGTAKNGR